MEDVFFIKRKNKPIHRIYLVCEFSGNPITDANFCLALLSKTTASEKKARLGGNLIIMGTPQNCGGTFVSNVHVSSTCTVTVLPHKYQYTVLGGFMYQ